MSIPTIIYFLLGTIWTDSTKSYEQLTVDYFFETIWTEEYTDYKSIEFDFKTDTSVYIGAIYSCVQWDDKEIKEVEEIRKIIKGQTKEQLLFTKLKTKIPVKKISNSKRLKLRIGRVIQIGDNYVVPFITYRPLHFVDHYFLKFDKDGRVIDKCRINK